MTRLEHDKTRSFGSLRVLALALGVASLIACGDKKSKSNDAVVDKDPNATQGKTTGSLDTGPATAVPKNEPAPALRELPADPAKDGKAEHRWSIGLGGVGRDNGRAMALDSADNVIIGGLVTGKVVFPGAEEFTTESNDAVIIKLDKEGKVLWTRHFGGPGSDMVEDVATDAAGNIIVGGGFADRLIIGDSSLSSAGSDDGFVAKFDGEGNRLWAKRLGGVAEDNVQSVATDAAGNIYVSASFREAVTLGTEEFRSEGLDDAYLISLTPDGEFRWVRKLAGPGIDFARDVRCSGQSIFWAGEFSQTATLATAKLESVGNRDISLAKLTSDGDLVWATSFGSLSDDSTFAHAVDAAGDIVLTGIFKDTMSIGSSALRSSGEYDVFVAKLADNGAPRWARSFGAKAEDVGAAITTDSFGNIFLGGWFRLTVDFGDGPLESKGDRDMFLVKLTRAGEPMWSVRFGGTQSDFLRRLAIASDGALILAGTFFQTINLGGADLVAGAAPKQMVPGSEIFAAKLAR